MQNNKLFPTNIFGRKSFQCNNFNTMISFKFYILVEQLHAQRRYFKVILICYEQYHFDHVNKERLLTLL